MIAITYDVEHKLNEFNNDLIEIRLRKEASTSTNNEEPQSKAKASSSNKQSQLDIEISRIAFEEDTNTMNKFHSIMLLYFQAKELRHGFFQRFFFGLFKIWFIVEIVFLL